MPLGPVGPVHPNGNTMSIDRYVQHAERFGVELVFETAAGLGQVKSDLTTIELVTLARRLKAIYPKFNVARPDQLVELSSPEVRAAYLDRIAPVLDQLGTPVPTSASRCCEWCGKSIAGRSDRRTCSAGHRKALDRAGGVGLFSRPDVTPTDRFDLSVALRPDVTPTAHEHGRFEGEKQGHGEFRKVPAGACVQLGLWP